MSSGNLRVEAPGALRLGDPGDLVAVVGLFDIGRIPTLEVAPPKQPKHFGAFLKVVEQLDGVALQVVGEGYCVCVDHRLQAALHDHIEQLLLVPEVDVDQASPARRCDRRARLRARAAGTPQTPLQAAASAWPATGAACW